MQYTYPSCVYPVFVLILQSGYNLAGICISLCSRIILDPPLQIISDSHSTKITLWPHQFFSPLPLDGEREREGREEKKKRVLTSRHGRRLQDFPVARFLHSGGDRGQGCEVDSGYPSFDVLSICVPFLFHSIFVFPCKFCGAIDTGIG